MHYNIRIRRFFIVVIAMQSAFRCDNALRTDIPYVPQATFAGYFNGDYDSLTGNRSWPNRCELIGDTVRICCYSSFFSESNRIRHGDLLRIDLLPDSSYNFSKRNVLFHLARYYERNESYTINLGDTIDNTIRFESQTTAFSRRMGGDIEIREIYVSTPPVSGTVGAYLTITKGRLLGRIGGP